MAAGRRKADSDRSAAPSANNLRHKMVLKS